MKFRTDFVTNSSSSSFSVSIKIMTDVGEFSELLDTNEDGMGKADLNCTPKDILNAGSVAELMELLRNAACNRVGWEDDEDWLEDRYKRQMAAFAKAFEKKVPSLEQIKRICLTRHFVAWGECSTGLLLYEEELKKLATEVCESESEAHEKDVKALQEYLEQKEVFAYGDSSDWPSGFMGNQAGGKYAWEGSVEDLAEQICSEDLSGNDDAIEVVDIDMVNKTVEFSAKYRLE